MGSSGRTVVAISAVGPPHAGRGLLRQAHVLQRSQPSHAHGVPRRIAFRFGGKPPGSLIHVAQDGTIEPSEPLGVDFVLNASFLSDADKIAILGGNLIKLLRITS